MNFRRYLKRWLKAFPTLYYYYTRTRYGTHTEVRDWVLSSQRFMRKKNLNSFIFDANDTWVKIDTGQEFKYAPEMMGGLLGLEFKLGFESQDISTVLKLLPKNPVVIDIGANFGIYSVVIASTFRNSEIHSFEPVPHTSTLLRSNVKRNCVDAQITINNAAVGSESGHLMITTDRYAGNYLLTGNCYDGTSQDVPVIRLDDYVAEKGLSRVDFIKCDVEGAELLVMKGARKTLELMHPIIMLEIAEEWTRRFGYTPDELIDFMSGYGYKCRHASEVVKQLTLDKLGSAMQTHNYFFFPED